MEPTREMIDDPNLYVDGKISTADVIAKVTRGGYRD
ncbi:antitoxin VbhA family protein [Microbacterium sp. T32]|nr:antitoxin VbhA family protein [Microbacterium sp. T32]